ncbi:MULTISPECIES: tRNA lysidine(34) synthetase TilS [unclassified Nosocomiicoccus]|uniref:tRNA lysidine(34) synthetase TilS n=1 Tax=unclassified Nosocomiicoccus TaxID=2646683 RepID=UPI0008A18976|nr:MULTISPECIES: tRNA lysidine(34) synthetase TilS [unclassified Nosocomiicoccus]OFL49456.1 hypothetical protein HMPREF2767_06000 [Nosocomiicoccus sp. HMSC067E10]OFS61636.1 hypothetical protein HMPREF3177_07475 [Nosocomiicoccus sp. HMSC09A07]
MVKLNVTWTPSDNIAIALSGGIDSTVLYHLLTTRYRDTYRELYILHVNHGSREASIGEEQALRKMADSDGYVFLSTTLNLDKFSQRKGRDLRYAFFYDMLNEYDIDYCLTAHHKDDDFETIMFELLTGRHLKGIGIPSQFGKVLRPMMSVRLQEIEQYAHEHRLEYFEDHTNDTNDYTRNYIRHEVLPNIEQHDELHLESLTQFKEDYNEMTQYFKQEAESFLKDKPVSRKRFNACSHILKVYILNRWLNVGRAYSEEMIRLLQSDTSQFELPVGEQSFVCSYDDCYVISDRMFDEEMTIDDAGTYYFNGYKITVDGSPNLTVRTFQPGDRVAIPNVGTKKVNRLFIDKKISHEKRKTMPIIVDDTGTIVAVGNIYNIIELLSNFKIDLHVEELYYDA